jgi:hypothetical protein
MGAYEVDTRPGLDWASSWPGAGVLRRVRQRREARRVAARLRSLEDHLLRDIGLSRADLDALSR